MNINELINQKLEWLRYADEQHIAQKIATVCFQLGNKYGNRIGVESAEFWDRYTEFNAIRDKNSFNLLAGKYDEKLFTWVIVDKIYVCQLEYINDKPNFPINAETVEIYDVESPHYIFVPGKWVDRLNENYEIALNKIRSQKTVEEKRVCRLAAQLLIDPKVEV